MKGLREAFEKAIEADPYDIQTRREFSDWLDENTDEADLAAFHRETTREQIKEGEQFLKGIAVRCGGAFTDLIERLRKYVKEGTTFTFGDELGFEAEGRLDGDWDRSRRHMDAERSRDEGRVGDDGLRRPEE